MNNPALKMTSSIDSISLKKMADCIRVLSMDAVAQAKSGHQGMPMGMADIAAVLMRHFLRFNPEDPNWLGRDRLVLSNGHGSMLLYSVLHLTGYDLSMEDIKNFRQLGSKTPGHPEFGEMHGVTTPGVETTTGPLGQGIANAVGMALAQKRLAAMFGEELFGACKTYVTLGDGCLMEGISHEACELAAHWNLNNLIVLFDDNAITIDGKTDLSSSTDVTKRFEAYGFEVLDADGHDADSIFSALSKAQSAQKPVFIKFKTTIGFGSPSHKGTSSVHGNPIKGEGLDEVRKELGWNHPPFEVPEDVYADWHMAADHGKQGYANWLSAFEKSPQKTEIENLFNSNVEAALSALQAHKAEVVGGNDEATRKSSGNCIKAFAAQLQGLVSGSADLSGSNNTQTGGAVLDAQNYSGNYIHYGVREHAMGAIMNGLSLSGMISMGGTFLTFADYMREPIRLAALMKQGVIFVMTHDSIGVGEDGPTHQPVEHVAMLRATPGLNVFRPADAVETAECWQLALQNRQTPSVMVLTRQNLPQVRTEHVEENLSAKGGYILSPAAGEEQGVLIATGSEVHIALAAQKELAAEGKHVRVVSMPCCELFDAEPKDYRDKVLPPHLTKRIAIEAAVETGWHKYIGLEGAFIGMKGFGASAPAEQLFEHFGITLEKVINSF